MYALGAILYEMLTRLPPVGRLKPVHELAKDVRPKVDRVIRKAMSPAKENRYDSAAAFAKAVESAQKLGESYIYSWKPNPAAICGNAPDYDAVEKAMRQTIGIAKGCALEIVMKDTHTFQGEPERIIRWSRIASRLAAEAA